MKQPFQDIKYIPSIRQNVLDIVNAIPQQFKLSRKPVNHHLKFANTFLRGQKGISNSLADQNKNDDMLLQDLFGAINY